MTHAAHPDPAALERAIRAAERNWRRIATESGWPAWAVDLLARPNAEINVAAAWAELKRATRPPMEDGR